MAVNELLQVSPDNIPAISSHIQKGLEKDGYGITVTERSDGGYEIKASKNLMAGFFVSSIITLVPEGNYHVRFNAEKEEYFTDIFRMILITICTGGTYFVIFVIMQVVGLLINSALNNRAHTLAVEAIRQTGSNAQTYSSAPTGNSVSNPEPAQPKLLKQFCTSCGAENAGYSKFCGNCGSPLTAMPQSDETVQAQPEQPVSQPVVEPKPVYQPKSVDRQPKTTPGKKFIMTITKSMSFSGVLLFKGICKGVISPDQYIRIESEEGLVVVTKVLRVEVNGIQKPESEIGKEVVLTVEQIENFQFKPGDKVYLK